MPSGTRRRIYLMRHGEVSYFDELGRLFEPNSVPLNAEGRRQAEAAAEWLQRVSLDRVVTSGLPRTVETAERTTLGRGLPIEVDADLREIQPGPVLEMTETIETTFVHAMSGDITPDRAFLGGETFGALDRRVGDSLARLLADGSWRQMLVAAHGGVNRAILCRALGGSLRGFGNFEQDAACINIIDAEADGTLLVRLVNFTPYNPLKIGMEETTMERLYAEYLRVTGRRGPRLADQSPDD